MYFFIFFNLFFWYCFHNTKSLLSDIFCVYFVVGGVGVGVVIAVAVVVVAVFR